MESRSYALLTGLFTILLSFALAATFIWLAPKPTGPIDISAGH